MTFSERRRSQLVAGAVTLALAGTGSGSRRPPRAGGREHPGRRSRAERPLLRDRDRGRQAERLGLHDHREPRVQHGHARERDEDGRDGAVAEPVQLHQRRPDPELGHQQRQACPRPRPGVVLPAARLDAEHVRHRPAQRDAQPRHAGRHALQGQALRLGRGERGLRRRRLRRASRLQPAAHRQRLDRGRVPRRPRRRPGREALLQRLQHRQLVGRQDPGRLRHGPGLQVPRRPDRLRGLPVALQRAEPGPVQLRHHPAQLRRPGRRRADHRARHRGLRQLAGPELPACRPGVPLRLALHRHHGLGSAGLGLVALRRHAAALRRLRQQEGRLHLGAQRAERSDADRPDAHTDADTHAHPDTHSDSHSDADRPADDRLLVLGDLCGARPVVGRLHRLGQDQEHRSRHQRVDAERGPSRATRRSSRRGARPPRRAGTRSPPRTSTTTRPSPPGARSSSASTARTAAATRHPRASRSTA